MSALKARRGPRAPSRLARQRQRLEAAVEAALAALDALDGDPDLEEGGDQEGDWSDWEREEDGRVNPAWMIGDRWHYEVDGVRGCRPLDPDDDTDTVLTPRSEWGMAR